MQVTNLLREFRFNKSGNQIILTDIPSLTENEIKDFYATQYPELTNASVISLGIIESKRVYTFKTTIGDKG